MLLLLFLACAFSYITLFDFPIEGSYTLAPWKESMSNLDSILKNRDITLPTKVHLVKAMVFQVVMYGCVSDYKES